MAKNNEAIKLRCYGGNPIPDQVLKDWLLFCELDEKIQYNIWNLIKSIVYGQSSEQLKSEISEFCNKFYIEEKKLTRSLGLLTHMLQQATKYDLSKNDIENDFLILKKLKHGEVDDIITGYVEVKNEIKIKFINNTLLSHGKLIVGVDWKIENIEASNDAFNIHIPVVTLTFRYREGDDSNRISLRMTTDTIEQLQSALSEISKWIAPKGFKFSEAK